MKIAAIILLFSNCLLFANAGRYGLLRVGKPTAVTSSFKQSNDSHQRELFDEDFHAAFRKLYGNDASLSLSLAAGLSFSMPELQLSLSFSMPVVDTPAPTTESAQTPEPTPAPGLSPTSSPTPEPTDATVGGTTTTTVPDDAAEGSGAQGDDAPEESESQGTEIVSNVRAGNTNPAESGKDDGLSAGQITMVTVGCVAAVAAVALVASKKIRASG